MTGERVTAADVRLLAGEPGEGAVVNVLARVKRARADAEAGVVTGGLITVTDLLFLAGGWKDAAALARVETPRAAAEAGT